MSKRVSYHIPTLLHDNPIPNVTRKGNVITSSGIFGFYPEEGKKGKGHRFPDTIQEESTLLLQNMKTTVETAGGTVDDIIDVKVFMGDKKNKEVLNGPWKSMFPDEHSEPTRGTTEEKLSYGNIRCQFIAVVDD
ncbi:MAG: hypothetical protein A2751_00810 [Candidatus Doudnabacteria bacterium RIFCSPHIGHO2_01_FULL_46_14]|uniref:Enamine deaminase RidA n=1 Tax=Candidatus Doudnabacteria bacterium RIFCSPHIGHO2_01_FULL_46_14 TaxID=1817824 RepID=A0A1F5NMY0_9BACT|nr:MAG: hypothetical protein A2751_00810 [Candidatus Doudnabacteria bacterium RIFCSPHIGHO2_01_FULL_46_14]